MSSLQWLRDLNGADIRESIYQERPGAWEIIPSMSCYSSYELRRLPSFNDAVVYRQDWAFEQQDKGAFSVTLDGSRAAKNGLVIAIGSELADAFGFYVVLSPSGAQVFRRVIGEISPTADFNQYWRQENIVPAAGQIQAVAAPLQKSGPVQFTVVYDYGTLYIFDGAAPYKGTLLVKYINPQPGMGNHKWGLGLYGPANGDKLCVTQIKKWSASYV